MSNPLIGLGQVFTAAPLSSDNIGTDPLFQSVKDGLTGGQGTTDYFAIINSMSQIYQQFKNNGRHAWDEGFDDNDLPVYYVASMSTSTYKQFYNIIRVDGLNLDDNGVVATNGTTTVINGITYQGIGVLTNTSGWDAYKLSTTSWWLGACISGTITFNEIMGDLKIAIRAVADAQADAIQGIANDPAAQSGGEEAEEDEDEENVNGDDYITTQAGDEVAILEVEEGAVAWGDVFLGAGIVLAVRFVVLSFFLQNSFQYVRVWNLTRYNLVWIIQFDKSQNTDEGQLAIGPVHFNTDDSIAAYEPLLPLNSSPALPGATPLPTAQFADMIINSSSQDGSIGYVLQYQLQDPTSGQTVYTGTAYFDIPFGGVNSTNVTFDSVSDLQTWYNNNSGNNQTPLASTTSSDGKVSFFTTFDYLNGQHAVPQSSGGSPPIQYYYQSLVAFVENDLPSTLQTAPKALPAQLFQVDPLKGIHPKIRRRVFGSRGKTPKSRKV